MDFVVVTPEFGIIVRRRALTERGVSLEDVLSAVESDAPLGQNEELMTFGPSFGSEALDVTTKRLISIGLVYFDDFFEFVGDFPPWCGFGVRFATTPPT